MSNKPSTVNFLLGIKSFMAIPVFILALMLWFYTLQTIEADAGLWAIWIAWLVLVGFFSFVSIGLDNRVIETTVDAAVLRYFSRNGYGNRFGV